ncbi:hypothetical protein ACHQM5_023375 [Ranunculus cassubicifolius]
MVFLGTAKKSFPSKKSVHVAKGDNDDNGEESDKSNKGDKEESSDKQVLAGREPFSTDLGWSTSIWHFNGTKAPSNINEIW